MSPVKILILFILSLLIAQPSYSAFAIPHKQLAAAAHVSRSTVVSHTRTILRKYVPASREHDGSPALSILSASLSAAGWILLPISLILIFTLTLVASGVILLLLAFLLQAGALVTGIVSLACAVVGHT